VQGEELLRSHAVLVIHVNHQIGRCQVPVLRIAGVKGSDALGVILHRLGVLEYGDAQLRPGAGLLDQGADSQLIFWTGHIRHAGGERKGNVAGAMPQTLIETLYYPLQKVDLTRSFQGQPRLTWRDLRFHSGHYCYLISSKAATTNLLLSSNAEQLRRS